MPPYPIEDCDAFLSQKDLLDLVRSRSKDIIENKKTAQRILDERKALKAMLNVYAKAGLEEQTTLTLTKLKDNKKFLDLLAEDQRHNKEEHSEFSADLCRAIQEEREEENDED